MGTGRRLGKVHFIAVGSRTGSEISNVGKYVQDRHDSEGDEAVSPNLLDGILEDVSQTVARVWRSEGRFMGRTLTSFTTLNAFSKPA